MSRTTHSDLRRPDGTAAARAARYLLAVVIVVVMVAGWKAAARWLSDGARLASHLGGDPGEPLVLVGGLPVETEGSGGVVAVGPDTPTRPSRSGARWTAEDDACLAEHPDESLGVIAHHLGRTPSAVALRKAALKRERRG